MSGLLYASMLSMLCAYPRRASSAHSARRLVQSRSARRARVLPATARSTNANWVVFDASARVLLVATDRLRRETTNDYIYSRLVVNIL